MTKLGQNEDGKISMDYRISSCNFDPLLKSIACGSIATHLCDPCRDSYCWTSPKLLADSGDFVEDIRSAGRIVSIGTSS